MDKKLGIYFAGSISGGRQKAEDYKKIIAILARYGKVLTEHIGSEALSAQGEVDKTDVEIYERDVAWVRKADILVADVTVVSMGVGYEIGYAESFGKKVICLYQVGGPGKLSSMISGNKKLQVIRYIDLEDLEKQLVALLI